MAEQQSGLLAPIRQIWDRLRNKQIYPGSNVTPAPWWPWNWWQKDFDGLARDADFQHYGPVQTCINIISQDLARTPAIHVRALPDGSFERVKNSAPARIFRKPNTYQSISDFWLFVVRSLLSQGNGYAIALRNGRQEVDSLWPLPSRSVFPYIVPSTGDVVYSVSKTDSLDLADPQLQRAPDFFVPSEDMLHLRMQTPRNPLVGESQLTAALYPTIMGTEINKKSAAFFANMQRPGGVLTHPGPGTLEPEAMARIKKRWQEIVGGANTGEIAVLMEGMQWQQIEMSAVDAELAAIYKLAERQIFQLYRVPMYMGGDMENISLDDPESLSRYYVQSCLAFYTTHLANSLTDFFRLPPTEAIEFDLDEAMLVGNLESRINALGKGVQNAIFAPDEARARLGLGPVEFGEKPRVQQQLVPLEFGVTQAALQAQQLVAGASANDAEPPPQDPPPDDAEDRAQVIDFEDILMKASGYE